MNTKWFVSAWFAHMSKPGSCVSSNQILFCSRLYKIILFWRVLVSVMLWREIIWDLGGVWQSLSCWKAWLNLWQKIIWYELPYWKKYWVCIKKKKDSWLKQTYLSNMYLKRSAYSEYYLSLTCMPFNNNPKIYWINHLWFWFSQGPLSCLLNSQSWFQDRRYV